MLTAAEVKKFALAHGADMAGVANIERFEGAPVQMDPRQIMPEARSVIGLVFRVMRGSLRGVEEGTFFSNYSAMGYGGLTYLYMPMTVINIARFIEDAGYEAIPYGHQSDWRAIGQQGELRDGYSRPVAPGRAAPDVMVHLRMAAFLAGLGEIGFSKMFLSPRFGPRNRVGIVITEAELEPDPLYDGPPLCNRCMACVEACPVGAFPRDRTVKVTVAGRQLEWADMDMKACQYGLIGGAPMADDEEAPEYHDPVLGRRVKPGSHTPFYRKPRNLYNTGTAICGAAGCTRACMMSLEARGVLANRFKQPFRRRKPWSVDWSRPADAPQPQQNVARDSSETEVD